MTPLEIEIMLHYATRCNDYRDGDFSAPAVQDALMRFVAESGLLRVVAVPGQKPGEPCYEITDRGIVYVAALKAVPLPIQKWVMP